MRRLVLSLLVFAFALPAVAQVKHPFTFEDMMKLKRVGDPQVSPDGKWVIFSVVDVDLEANTKTPHVWIVPLNHTAGSSSASGGLGMTSEREIIADQDADRPRWAPEGKRFAFLSTKEGGSQVWIADFDAASETVTGVHKLTSIATEDGGELWSPDGKNILFTSNVYPECDGAPEAENPCNAKKLDEANKSKVKAQIFDHLLYRHWNAYKEGKRSHIFVTDACVAAAGGGCPHMGSYRDLTPGDYDAPVFSLGGQDNYAFSPDGQEICYASNHDKNPAASTNNDLWIVPVSGGPAKNITADNPASDSTPLYSPDGRYIAYRAQQRPGYESDRFRLMLYDRKTGEKKNLTEGFDQWVGTYTWTPSSKAIYFSAGERGDAPLFRIGLNSSVVMRAMQGTYDDFNFTSEGKTLLLTQNSIAFPTRVEAVDTTGVEEIVAKMSAERPKSAEGGLGDITDLLPKVLADPAGELLSKVEMTRLESFWLPALTTTRSRAFWSNPRTLMLRKNIP